VPGIVSGDLEEFGETAGFDPKFRDDDKSVGGGGQ
jgi:hypothetical protein